jgi:hypothetical protein
MFSSQSVLSVFPNSIHHDVGAFQAASGVSSSYEALLDLFQCLGSFLRRLDIYTRIPPTPIMTDIIVKIMAELLSVLALATNQIKQGRFSKHSIACASTRSSLSRRKVCKEAVWRERSRGRASEVGSIDSGRGSDHGGSDLECGPWSRK